MCIYSVSERCFLLSCYFADLRSIFFCCFTSTLNKMVMLHYVSYLKCTSLLNLDFNSSLTGLPCYASTEGVYLSTHWSSGSPDG